MAGAGSCGGHFLLSLQTPALYFSGQPQWAKVFIATRQEQKGLQVPQGVPQPTQVPLVHAHNHWAIYSEHLLRAMSPPCAITRSRQKEPLTWPRSQRSGTPRAVIREARAKDSSAPAEGKGAGPVT